MSDLQVLFKDAAAPGEQRTLDIHDAMRRGDQLRRRGHAIRAGGVAVIALVVPLVLLQTTGGHTVQFVPDQREVFATPTTSPTPTPTPTPAPDPTPSPSETADAPVGVVVPTPGTTGEEPGAPAWVEEGSAPSAHDSIGTASRPSSRREGSARPPQRKPADTQAAVTEPVRDEPRAEPRPPRVRQKKQPAPTGNPRRASCELYGSRLAMGESESCTFVATHAGGYEARGIIAPFIYREDVNPPPEFWSVEIRRGDKVIRYSAKDAPGPCAENVIEPGDVVTAAVYTSDPSKDSGFTGSVDLFVGKGYGNCGPESE